MSTLATRVTTRELRDGLSEAIGRAMFAGDRIGVTRHGKLAAVLIGVEDLKALEAAEMADDDARRSSGAEFAASDRSPHPLA